MTNKFNVIIQNITLVKKKIKKNYHFNLESCSKWQQSQTDTEHKIQMTIDIGIFSQTDYNILPASK